MGAGIVACSRNDLKSAFYTNSSKNNGNQRNRRIKVMFRKKGTADKKELIEGVQLSTLVHGEKTLMGHFNVAKGAAIPTHSHPH